MSHHDRHYHGHDHLHHHDHDHEHHKHDKHHDHHHGHGHDHEQHHHADHDHGEKREKHSETVPSDRAKLMKVLEHWIHHNEDHAKSYGEWADRARKLGEEPTAAILDQIADETVRQNERFREALSLLSKETSESAPR